MGHISDYDTDHRHEGWVSMTLADGTLGSGTSTGAGFYIEGYTFLPADDNAASTSGVIDPAFLRPWSDVAGWVPRCECGWVGVAHLLDPDHDYGQWREPSDHEDELLMGQWRLHLRDTIPGAYPTRALARA